MADDLVSTIIPVYNDAERLRICLACLSVQTYSPIEAIVVDNGSADLDAVAAIANEYAFSKLVFEAMPGSYAARNRGIAEVVGEILAFTDADCAPATDWIEQGIAALRLNSECVIVGGAIEITMHNPEHPVELYKRVMGLDQAKFVTRDRYAATANMMTYSRVFERVGLFNPALKSSGDVEWGQRVFAAGYVQVYAPKALVQHPARRSFTLRQKVKVVLVLAFVRWVTIKTLLRLRVGCRKENDEWRVFLIKECLRGHDGVGRALAL